MLEYYMLHAAYCIFIRLIFASKQPYIPLVLIPYTHPHTPTHITHHQRLGFTNVHRLKGGIISYARALEEAGTGAAAEAGADARPAPHLTRNVTPLDSKFKGVNYVFDERMGTRITDDVLSVCELCGAKCDTYTNCASFDCHVRFIQCVVCATPEAYLGCCSVACQRRHAHALEERAAARGACTGAGAGVAPGMPAAGLMSRSMMKGTHKQQQQQQQRRPLSSSSSPPSPSPPSPSPPSSPPAVIDATFSADATPRPVERQACDPALDTTRYPVIQRERGGMLDHAVAFDAHMGALTDYCERQSSSEPPLLTALRAATEEEFEGAARMLSGPLQVLFPGRFY